MWRERTEAEREKSKKESGITCDEGLGGAGKEGRKAGTGERERERERERENITMFNIRQIGTKKNKLLRHP